LFELTLVILACLGLVGSFLLTALSCALHRLQKKESKKEIKSLKQFFLYHRLHTLFFPYQIYDSLIFAVTCSRALSHVVFLCSATLLLLPNHANSLGYFLGLIILLTIILFIFGDFLPRILGNRAPKRTLQLCALLSSPFLIAAFPFTLLFLKMAQAFWQKNAFTYLNEFNIAAAKHEIIDIIEEANIGTDLNAHERKLIESVVSFREKIAREVMVPRVDLFCLKAGTSIKEAAKLLENEGYSRTPVYKQSVDDIIGVLMYKDILKKYKEYEVKGNDPTVLDAPIESIIKNVLYTPETKKISSLLQDFRKKQVHLAIVVDEYGGTEGIVTIEDILEEIVGEIEDEYDEEEDLFIHQPDGSWIVDARMSLLDVEEQLGITIPQEGDYDTVGGYIFHHAGSIPSKGFVIKHDDFTLEILRSNDRFVEKVRIKPIKKEGR